MMSGSCRLRKYGCVYVYIEAVTRTRTHWVALRESGFVVSVGVYSVF